MRKKTKTPYALEQKVFFALLSTIFILFSTYIYFVSASIVHVIVRKEIDRDIAKVSSHISDLEARFIEAKDAVNEDHIAAHGFTVVSPEKIYITKTESSLVLVSENEI